MVEIGSLIELSRSKSKRGNEENRAKYSMEAPLVLDITPSQALQGSR
jgi:hypothetical protein